MISKQNLWSYRNGTISFAGLLLFANDIVPLEEYDFVSTCEFYGHMLPHSISLLTIAMHLCALDLCEALVQLDKYNFITPHALHFSRELCRIHAMHNSHVAIS